MYEEITTQFLMFGLLSGFILKSVYVGKEFKIKYNDIGKNFIGLFTIYLYFLSLFKTLEIFKK